MNQSEKLLEKFLGIEKQFNLFSFRPEGIPIWELVRFKVYARIKTSLFTENIHTNERDVSLFFSGMKEYVRNCYFNNPYRHEDQVNVLIVNHPRRKKSNSGYNDIYVDSFIDELDESNLVLERLFKLSHFRPAKTKNLYYFDWIEYPSRVIAYLPLINNPSDKVSKLFDEIEKKIRRKWGINSVLFKDEAVRIYKSYKYMYPKLEKLLDRLSPKKIINVVSYEPRCQMLTLAAKNRNIPVIELQHGTVGRHHIAYNYGEKEQVQAYPDYFFAWGKNWVKDARMPISYKNIKLVGYPYIDQFQDRDISRDEKRIIVLSQLREDIANLAYYLAKKLTDYKIIFKAHPKEYDFVKKKYSKLLRQDNLEIIDQDKEHLYVEFLKSGYVFGVYSTAIVESLVFCPNVCVMKFYGWENLRGLEDYGVNYYNDKKEAVKNIKNGKTVESKADIQDFFENNALSKMCERIKSI